MSDTSLKLLHAPIVEAIVDIYCDMRPDFDLEEVADAAKAAYIDDYPKLKHRHFTEHVLKGVRGGSPEVATREGLQAFQFLKEDEKQLVQVRTQGYSFNRLEPYDSLDIYLPEIKRTWSRFLEVAAPRRIRSIGLRYINRIRLPADNGIVNLDAFLHTGPRLPKGSGMTLTGFTLRNEAVDKSTGATLATVITDEPSDDEKLSVILDIATKIDCDAPPEAWNQVDSVIVMLRELKNHVFEGMLEEKCLAMYR